MFAAASTSRRRFSIVIARSEATRQSSLNLQAGTAGLRRRKPLAMTAENLRVTEGGRHFSGRSRVRPPQSDDLDRHVRQALQLAEQHVALHHRADIFRRAGIDDVAS